MNKCFLLKIHSLLKCTSLLAWNYWSKSDLSSPLSCGAVELSVHASSGFSLCSSERCQARELLLAAFWNWKYQRWRTSWRKQDVYRIDFFNHTKQYSNRHTGMDDNKCNQSEISYSRWRGIYWQRYSSTNSGEKQTSTAWKFSGL